MQERKVSSYSLLKQVLILTLLHPTIVGAEDNLLHSLVGGKFDLMLRYRFEYADDDAQKLEEAYASTLRSALGYRTGSFFDTSLYFQFQDVRIVGDDDTFHDGIHPSPRATITDPESSEVQQYYLRYGGLPKTVITLGRQEINHRTGTLQRFVGNVSFRQHAQSFDAAHVVSLAIPDTVIDYSYIWNVNRITGEKSNDDDWRSNSHLLNLQYNGLPGLRLESYLYLLEFTKKQVNHFLSATAGLRLQGDRLIAPNLRFNYAGEFAHQQDYGNNPNSLSVSYALAELGLNYAVGRLVESISLKYDYERLEGQGENRAFQTPLGTNHAFQGFADRFLTTPDDGIQDHFVTLSAKLPDTQMSLVFHQLISDRDHYDYGYEWDFVAEHNINKHFLAGFKFAAYRADQNSLNMSRNVIDKQAFDLTRCWAYLQFTY